MYDNYSVLMSVYYKEDPSYFMESIKSMLSQTKITNDFVLVCDGPLTKELEEVINYYLNGDNGHLFNVVRLKENFGLGIALNKGIIKCKNELVARMDSDDISDPYRCEKEIKVFNNDEEIGIIGSIIDEFSGNIDNKLKKRTVPEKPEMIYSFSKKRNPFNHPSVMFKKSLVLSSGCYNEKYHLFEDYYLWIRMFVNGVKGYNIQEILLHMRNDDNQIERRGGIKYAKTLLSFHKWIHKIGWSSIFDYLTGAIPHAIISVLPLPFRKIAYAVIRNQ